MVRVLVEEEERLTRFTRVCILDCFHIGLILSRWDWIEMNMDFGWIDMVMKVYDSLWKWTLPFIYCYIRNYYFTGWRNSGFDMWFQLLYLYLSILFLLLLNTINYSICLISVRSDMVLK